MKDSHFDDSITSEAEYRQREADDDEDAKQQSGYVLGYNEHRIEIARDFETILIDEKPYPVENVDNLSNATLMAIGIIDGLEKRGQFR
jgi:hypothetical protein